MTGRAGAGGTADLVVRPLAADELSAAADLGRLAFGSGPPPTLLEPQPGVDQLGAFDVRGRLLGKARDHHYGQAYAGRWLRAAGVAGVAVAPEARGRGVARELLTALVRAARERGAVVSPLFPTAPAVYPALGWEVVGSYVVCRVPALALAGLRVPEDVTVRLAEPGDYEDLRRIYTRVALGTDGLLDRDGPLFAARGEQLLADLDGVSVATGPSGEAEGYVSWERGPGYDAGGRVLVHDLLALTPRATTALLAVLGSWAPVAPALELRLLDTDAMSLPVPVTDVVRLERWMSRVLDAPGLVAARGWPTGLRGSVDVDLADPLVPEHAGPHRLVVEDGRGRWERGGSCGARTVRLHVRALSALLAGGVTTEALRRAGLLDGDPTAAAGLDGLCARPRPQLLGYF